MAPSANEEELQTMPVVDSTQSFISVFNTANPLAAGIMKEVIEHDANQSFSDADSSLDSSSATPSSTEGPLSSVTSMSSDFDSPYEEKIISAAKLVTGPKTGMEDNVAEPDMPSLKGAGKSDCAVYVVGIHECEKDVAVASLSDENSAWDSEAMQVVPDNSRSVLLAPYEYELSLNGSRATQVQKARRRPTLPHRHQPKLVREESRPIGVSSPRQYVNESTLRRLSSGLWAVRKQAFRGGKQDGSRLLKQIQKQVIYSATCRTNPIIAMISTPEVYGLSVPMGELSEGSIIVDMEYIPFNDVRSVILDQDKTIHDWLIGSAISVIDQELTQSSNVRLESILPEFHKKASNIKTHLPGSSLLTVDERQEVTGYFDLILTHYASLQDLEVPVGPCHGDLTLQNMLVDPVNRELCIFDFLDSFVESPLQDIAKLLQDCRHQWFFTQVEIPEKALPRVVTALESFNNRIDFAYFKYAFWEALPLFEFFTLARILPYMTQINEKQCILNGLRRIIQDLDHQKTSDRTPPEDGMDREAEVTTTVIIPALGNDMGKVYTDGQIKLLAMNHSGRPLIVDCISNLVVDRVSSIVVAVVKPLVELSCGTTTAFEELFRSLGEEKYQKMRFHYAGEMTQDAVETVTLAINTFNIRGPVFIKAADNSFAHSVDIGNYVSVSGTLQDRVPIKFSEQGSFHPNLIDATEKNFVSFLYDNVVSNIAHKSFVSSQFCCGGWAFLEAADFLSAAGSLRSLLQSARSTSGRTSGSNGGDAKSPLGIVDAVWLLMSQGHFFFGARVSAYDDWGTRAAWMASRGRESVE